MVVLGTINGRMKDFYDIWLLAQTFDFQGEQLSHAVKANPLLRAAAVVSRGGVTTASACSAVNGSRSLARNATWSGHHGKMKPMPRTLLLVALLAAGTASAGPADLDFAVVQASAVAPGPDAALKPVQVLMTARTSLEGRVVLLDAEGHVGVGVAGGEPLVLPFSEPMVEAILGWSTPLDLVCGRTRRDDLECLAGAGDLPTQLRADDLRKTVRRLRVPSLAHRVKRMYPTLGACLAVGDVNICLHHEVEGVGAQQRHRLLPLPLAPNELVRPSFDPAGLGPASARCSLTAKQTIRCEGSAAYGRLGNGEVGTARGQSVPVLPPVTQLAAGDGFFCARTNDDEVWCWGSVPYQVPLEAPMAEHYPLCRFDRAATDLKWERERKATSEAAAACQRAKHPAGARDSCLGIVGPPKQLIFERSSACEVPQVIPDQWSRPDDPNYPREELISTKPRLAFSSRPIVLKAGPAIAVAAWERKLCLLDGERQLHCFGD